MKKGKLVFLFNRVDNVLYTHRHTQNDEREHSKLLTKIRHLLMNVFETNGKEKTKTKTKNMLKLNTKKKQQQKQRIEQELIKCTY